MVCVVIAGPRRPASTCALLADLATRAGHDVRELPNPHDAVPARRAVTGADAVVIVPRRGQAWRHTYGAVRRLLSVGPEAHMILVSSFAVGHGAAHGLNRTNRSLLPARVAAEQALRDSGLPYSVVRPTWLTNDPAGAHAIALTQDPGADGMVSRADLATVIMAAIEQPTARGATFAVYNEPGRPPADWAPAFAHLRTDPLLKASTRGA